MSRARDATIAVATELFAERGYSDVTIRDIAYLANLSPAMIIKCFGSKENLFHEVATVKPLSLPDVPDSELGERLVRDLFDRFQANAIEPMARAFVLRLTAPDPDSVRKNFTEGYFDPLAERLGGGADARLRAELVVSALVGLAATLRIFDPRAISERTDEVQHSYGMTVQRLLDG
ncbi:TetR/AcrR family transcriptional regulator [Rhodococcus globerulus]|uniref:TetR family transcriptional regulator n=1 Tax=Rhodococcus globerulus TaxID=33008 RepID=A0ABU4C368_RHOGO|nr:TetR family transcriptional regulator [Rhodococcus globerulus]MDV6270855.1 TetR family transcriptional regulator [Rhodococcus globerulus]